MTPTDVTRIIEKIDDAIERLAVLETKLSTHASHDQRIGSLERSRAMLAGLVVFIGLELQALGLLLVFTARSA